MLGAKIRLDEVPVHRMLGRIHSIGDRGETRDGIAEGFMILKYAEHILMPE
ncbi:hypothetical protein D3C86_2036600 [compost metagenome]